MTEFIFKAKAHVQIQAGDVLVNRHSRDFDDSGDALLRMHQQMISERPRNMIMDKPWILLRAAL